MHSYISVIVQKVIVKFDSILPYQILAALNCKSSNSVIFQNESRLTFEFIFTSIFSI